MAYLHSAFRIIACGLLAAACSSSGSSSDDDPTASIGLANAEDIAGAVIRTAFASSDVGGLGGAVLPGGAEAAAARKVEASRGDDIGPDFDTRDPFGPSEDDCDEGGTVTVSGDLAVPSEFSIGDFVIGDFAFCDDGEVVLDGGLEFTILDLVGDLFGDEFLVVFDLVMRMLDADDGDDVLSMDGDGVLSIDTTMPPVASLGLAGDELEISNGVETAVLMDYTTTLVFDEDAGTYTLSASGRMEHTAFVGDVLYETEEVFGGEGEDDPDSGLFVIFGALDALIHIIPDANAIDVDVEVDLDGNGTPEGLIETTWDELLGNV